ncbi:Hsp20 family protein [Ensifer sp. ZNC0028]|uniref:Hsp20 family protein n=1 Tax=Ensifer sp. ZNC0028 TaxID=1339236 RepID=UPI0005BAAA34|nr:Hsp20 family protein [Ensifer sp. ZNC0028]
MRANFDFSPFQRSSIGFDRIFDLLENSNRNVDTWPPYNIVKLGEGAYRIMIVVAGFAEDELTITHEANTLVVNGAKSENEEIHYLHRGVALRPFVRRFELADHVLVEGAKLENGLLVIDLKKQVPEEMKPRRIAIETDMKTPASKQIEGDKAA